MHLIKMIDCLQEVCNLVIEMARKSVDPQTIFHEEAEESLESVRVAIRNLKEFKTCFQEYKAKLSTYFSPGEAFLSWDFRVGLN